MPFISVNELLSGAREAGLPLWQYVQECSANEAGISPEKSWDMMARSRVTWWPHSAMPKGILQVTDLPDIYEEIARRMPFAVESRMDTFMRTVGKI